MIDAAGLKRPVLVGWSYAGRVISDYITYRGANGISGIDFVDASIKFVPEYVGDNLIFTADGVGRHAHQYHRDPYLPARLLF